MVPQAIQPESAQIVKPISPIWKCSKSGEDKQTDRRAVPGNERRQPGLKGLKGFLQ
jgi:hypothetical protein